MTVKPKTRSVLGLRGNWPNGGYALSRATNPSLNMGLNDAVFLVTFQKITDLVHQSLYVGMKIDWTNGYYWEFELGKAYLVIYYGGVPLFVGSGILSGGFHSAATFVDRDGNVEHYIDGGADGSGSVSAAGAANLDNNTDFLMQINYTGGGSYSYSQPLLHYEQWFIDPADFPAAAERARIAQQFAADPYTTPSLMTERANAATEQRLALTFENLDPAATTITDESAYGNHVTIAGGATVADCMKEYAGV